MSDAQKLVEMVRNGLSLRDALFQSSVVGKGSLGGHKFYYMEDGSRVWRAIRYYLDPRGPMVPAMSACCAPPSDAPRPADYRAWSPTEADPE